MFVNISNFKTGSNLGNDSDSLAIYSSILYMLSYFCTYFVYTCNYIGNRYIGSLLDGVQESLLIDSSNISVYHMKCNVLLIKNFYFDFVLDVFSNCKSKTRKAL